MTPTEIENALGQRLKAMTDVPPIAWPNRDANPARPFLHFQHVPVGRTDQTLDGAGEVASGYVTITVVSEQGEFANPANDLAAMVMAQFPYGLELVAGSGVITVMKPPEEQAPFKDGADWRQPVRIDYEAEE